jgi:hypothetical protein
MQQHSLRQINQDGLCRTPWGDFHGVYVKVRFGERFCDWLMIEARLISRLRCLENKRKSRWAIAA